MSPDGLFQAASSIALLGWIALALGPLAPRAAGLVGGVAIPLVLSGGYAAIVPLADAYRPGPGTRSHAGADPRDGPDAVGHGQPQWIGGTASDAGGLFFFGWSRDGGDLRAAHILPTHAMHVVPLAAVACTRLFGPAARAPVQFAALAYVGLVALVFSQALRGLPLIAA